MFVTLITTTEENTFSQVSEGGNTCNTFSSSANSPCAACLLVEPPTETLSTDTWKAPFLVVRELFPLYNLFPSERVPFVFSTLKKKRVQEFKAASPFRRTPTVPTGLSILCRRHSSPQHLPTKGPCLRELRNTGRSGMLGTVRRSRAQPGVGASSTKEGLD